MTKKVFLGVCLNGFTPGAFIASLIDTVRTVRLGLVSLHPGNTQLFMARNELTAEFLRSDCTHLLFVDSDLIFSPEQIKRLLSHEEDIVAGIYPIKEDGPLRVAVNNYHDDERRPVRPDGLQSVRYVATGFMLIARGVFEKMLEHDRDKIEFQSDHAPHHTLWNFWRSEIYRDKLRTRYLTEDWLFCQRWLELGGEVFVDTQIFLRHVGTCTFPLQSQLEANAVKKFPDWMIKEVEQCIIELDPPPNVVLDIGANIGAFADLCAEKWPAATIHAYEPVPHTFKALKELAGPGVVAHCQAVRDFNGMAEINLGDHPCVNGFIRTARSTGKTLPVHCIAASSLPPAEFVKIDTEGLEVEILRNIKLESVVALVVEAHTVADKAEIEDIAATRGFTLVEQVEQNGPGNVILKFRKIETPIL